MAAKFRAMNNADFSELRGCVKKSTKSDAYLDLDNALDNVSMFGGYEDSSSVIKYHSRMHNRAYIALKMPVFNYVLSQAGARLLGKILGVDGKLWTDIVNVSVLYDIDNDEYVRESETDIEGHYLYGAQIAERLIGLFDIADETRKCLLQSMSSLCKDGENFKYYGYVDKSSDSGTLTIKLCGGYFYHANPSLGAIDQQKAALAGIMKRGKTLDDVHKYMTDGVFKNQYTRLSYLINIPRDKRTLYGMLNYEVSIVPADMRPKAQNKEHKLTALYAAVINANNNLTEIVKESATPADIRVKYCALDKAVSFLQYKHVDTGMASVKKDDKSILERIKGKKGQIRLSNLGKRQDYSMRAVVTINPYLPLDQINIPRAAIPYLFQYHVLPYLAQELREKKAASANGNVGATNVYDRLKLSRLDDPKVQKEIVRIVNEKKILEKVPVMLGRQPTLHKHSYLSFHAGITDDLSIEISPLPCPAFNMDFDGDTAHGEVPLSEEACKEASELMMVSHNIYLPKTGECTIMPRQDMLYGYYIATRDTYKIGPTMLSYNTPEEVRRAVIKNQIKVWDSVHMPEYTALAGDIAFASCFPTGMVVPREVTPKQGQLQVCQITSKTIQKYINRLLHKDSFGNLDIRIGRGKASTETFVGAINTLVEFGFQVARIYSPSMSIVNYNYNSIPEYDNAISDFHKRMARTDLLYQLGIETQDNYKLKFDSELAIMSSTIEKHIYEKIGENNGFALLAQSGARGNKSNLGQIFAYKGRVKKNSNESFDALIENSYCSQLTPMEHFVAAYGGRQGLIDKSLKTGDTGYASRKMWHATQEYVISCEDCGTKDGLRIQKSYLATFCSTDDATKKQEEIKEIFKHAIIGHYRAGDNVLIGEDQAEKLANDDSVTEVTIRSPLRCKKPCCAKCYGIDWSNHKVAIVGTPVGLIAAQSIGEPATQLTMKQFQKGGVAGKADMTSAFDKVDKYISVSNIADDSRKGTYSGYDPLAWATGEIKVLACSDITSNRVMIEGSDRRIIVPKTLQLKKFAEKGSGISYKHGDYDLNEIMEYCSVEEAQKYFIFKLHSLYKSECNICMVHFEVLAAAMTRYMIVDTDRTDLMVGQYCTAKELYSGSLANTTYISRMLSVKDLPGASMAAMDAITMENQVKGLSRNCLLELEDPLEKPLSRMTLGKSILCGSAMPGYLNKRKEEI